MKDLWLLCNAVVFILSAAGIVLVFAGGPLLALAAGLSGKKTARPSSSALPAVTVLTVVRNGEAIIGAKIANTLELDYPADLLEMIVFSDGSTDGTEQAVAAAEDARVRLFSASTHQGKNLSLNKAVRECKGDIILFSDADALLEKTALRLLVAWFVDSEVGGVCGRRMVREKKNLAGAQSAYIGFDSTIKLLESRNGSITSNDGKIYAMRRELFRDLPPFVTDDLYNCLTVVRAGRRFLYEPMARAFVRVPSRDTRHEIGRRRRIVSRSLWGLLLNRALFNPFRFGLYAVRLFVNKVGRRFLPVFLVALFFSSLFLGRDFSVVSAVFVLQVCFYLLAFSHLFLSNTVAGENAPSGLLQKAASTAYYFSIGNYGSLLGLFDFILGRKFAKWETVPASRQPSA